MKVVTIIGKWEWLLSEAKISYKRYVGTDRLMEWPFPEHLDIDKEWNRLYVASEEVLVKKGVVKPVVEKVVSSGAGRPSRGIDWAKGDELYSLGVSVSKICRDLGVSRMSWYRYKKKIPPTI